MSRPTSKALKQEISRLTEELRIKSIELANEQSKITSLNERIKNVISASCSQPYFSRDVVQINLAIDRMAIKFSQPAIRAELLTQLINQGIHSILNA